MVAVASNNGSAAPLTDVVMEARRLIEWATDRSLSLFLLGGVAIELRRPPGRTALLPRKPKDIDFLVRKSDKKSATELLTAAGYEADWPFNAVNGRRRLLFRDHSHDRQVDVFVEEFEMCHRIPIAEGLGPRATTISLTDLLATKLQIYELNRKDQSDIINLLHDHPIVDEPDDSGIDKRRLARLCADDWSFWRTAKLNFERTHQALAELQVESSVRDSLEESLRELWRAIEEEPKPRKWRMRNRIGDRMQWYDLPDEVA